jgi:DNA-binding MarR family transcriptional regulator
MKDIDELGLRAWRTVLRSHARVMRAVDAELEAGMDLSARSYDVLVRLSRSSNGSLRMSELATGVLLSPSGITRLVDHLVARGLVSRRRDPADARGYLAELTKEGRALQRRASRLYDRVIQEHFAERLTEEQLQTIVEALEGLLA